MLNKVHKTGTDRGGVYFSRNRLSKYIDTDVSLKNTSEYQFIKEWSPNNYTFAAVVFVLFALWSLTYENNIEELEARRQNGNPAQEELADLEPPEPPQRRPDLVHVGGGVHVTCRQSSRCGPIPVLSQRIRRSTRVLQHSMARYYSSVWFNTEDRKNSQLYVNQVLVSYHMNFEGQTELVT